MTKGLDQGPRKRGFARTKVAFKENHQAWPDIFGQGFAKSLRGRFIG